MATMMFTLSPQQRTNLINRRSVPWLLEMFPFFAADQLLKGIVDSRLLLIGIAATAWQLMRDVGGASWGKRVVGLDVLTTSGDAPSLASRVLRNVVLLAPLAVIVEFFVAYKGSDRFMRRLGDNLAGTRVVDRRPDTYGRGAWSDQLFAAFLLYLLTLVAFHFIGLAH